MSTATLRAGVVGCGRISPAYLVSPARYGGFTIAGCADIDLTRARQRADMFDIPSSSTVDEMMTREDLDIIVNLTPPTQHFEVSMAAVAAGKSLYVEKPLATDRDDADRLMTAAAQAGVRVACSPDTFLSPAMQAGRTAIDHGMIGTPIGATAFFASRGPELVHPEPGFFYQPGAGPLLDIGPYYLTALVALLGPVVKVSGAASAVSPKRVVLSGERMGERVPVNTPTHVTATLEFGSGVVGTLLASFDVWATELPRIEIYGTNGTLSLPDPDSYTGRARLRQAGWPDWRDLPTSGHQVDRAAGLADLAHGLRTGLPHRADGVLARHVLDVALSILESSESGRHVGVRSSCARPRPVPMAGFLTGEGKTR